MHTIEIQVDEQFQEGTPVELLRQAVFMTLTLQQVRRPCEVAVVVTDDDALHELNRRFRGIDRPTDVLAFPDETHGPFVNAPGQARYLGDVVISFPRAAEQAAAGGHAVEDELQLLAVHGVLHLLGYDDQDEEQRAQMWAAQAAVLRALGVDEGVAPS